MKFDAANGDTGWVVDADGKLLPEPVSGDTETGDVICIDSGCRVPKRFKPPLRIIKMTNPRPIEDARELTDAAR